MSEDSPSQFVVASATLCLIGCLSATVLPMLTGASQAFTGSVTSSGVLGILFALRSLQLLRARGTPSLPPAVLTTIFGGWFMLAPLLYGDVGFLPTAGVQLAGTLISTFGLYVTVAGITGE